MQGADCTKNMCKDLEITQINCGKKHEFTSFVASRVNELIMNFAREGLVGCTYSRVGFDPWIRSLAPKARYIYRPINSPEDF